MLFENISIIKWAKNNKLFERIFEDLMGSS
jgi:hypothetical protein